MGVRPSQRQSFRVGRLSLGSAATGFVEVYTNAGSPTSGTSGTLANIAGPGSLLVDTTNKTLYQNTSTKASPTWSQIVNAAVARIIAAISASGAVSATVSGRYAITKAGVAALTLAAPGADGLAVELTSDTANAHTLTATGLLQTGSAAVNVATFNAQAGASLSLLSYNGKWKVMSANGVSFS